MNKKKEYIIVKAYPNSPSVGKTISWSEYDEQYIDEYCAYYSEKELQNKEFFEEVVEKEYEILEFKSANYIYKKRADGMFRRDGYESGTGWSEESFTIPNEHINKVKRLSDGEVFSLGDKIDSYGKILEIEKIVDKDGLMIWFTKGTWLGISKIKKYKEPKISFTTEDNHVVYEGESFKGYFITDEESSVNESSRAYGYWSGGTNPAIGKYFKTKEAANKYIDSKNEERLLDSKVLSYKQVETILDTYNVHMLGSLKKELKELVKSK